MAEVEPADIDDADIPLGEVDARAVATALAHFKAQRVAERRAARGAGAVSYTHLTLPTNREV